MKRTKIIALVLCMVFMFALVLTACDNKPGKDPNVTGGENGEPTVQVDKPRTMDITTLAYYGDTTENLDQKAAFRDYVSEKYGIDFKINSPARDTYIETIHLQMVSKDLVGMVLLFSGYEMIAWAQQGNIYALDEFLTGNETWETMIPEEWKEIYTWDGQVWGVPRGEEGHPYWFIRTMRGDWLDTVGMKKPETIDAFYEVSKAFTLNDPNKSGQNDTWGFCSRTMWLMQDMFHAFDARTSHEGDLIPLYNPNVNIWEDSVIKPEMAEAVSFLRKCYVEGLVHPELFSMSAADVRALMSDGKAGSCYYWDTWLISWENNVKKHTPTAYMVGIAAIGSNNISEKINGWKKGTGAPFVLSIHTEQPKEVVNWFVTLVYGTPESFFTFRYGIPQTSKDAKDGFFLDGKDVYLLMYQLDPSTATVKSTGFSAVTTGHPDFALDVGSFGYKLAYNSGDAAWDQTQAAANADNLKRRYEILNEYDDGRLFLYQENLLEPDNIEFTSVVEEWTAAGVKFVSDVMVDGVSPQDSLRSYLGTIMSFDPQYTLDLMNERLGKTTQQNYAELWSSLN